MDNDAALLGLLRKQPVLIADPPGKNLRLMKVISHPHIIAEREERVPDVNVDVDGELGRLRDLGQTAESSDSLRRAVLPMPNR
jgi:hypothetical protein